MEENATLQAPLLVAEQREEIHETAVTLLTCRSESGCKLHQSCFLADGSIRGDSRSTVQKKLIAACCLCFVFMIVEVVGGWLARSVAIMSDAAHMLSDVSSFLVALFAAWAATQPSTHHYSFGYHRAEIMGALVSVLIIWLVTGALVYEAVLRVINPVPVNGKLMFIVAGSGVIFNLLVALVLGHAHSPLGDHNCGHSHGDTHHHHGHNHSDGHHHEHNHSHNHNHSSETPCEHKHKEVCNHAHSKTSNGHSHPHPPHPPSSGPVAPAAAAHQPSTPFANAAIPQSPIRAEAAVIITIPAPPSEHGSCDHDHAHDHDHNHDHDHSAHSSSDDEHDHHHHCCSHSHPHGTESANGKASQQQEPSAAAQATAAASSSCNGQATCSSSTSTPSGHSPHSSCSSVCSPAPNTVRPATGAHGEGSSNEHASEDEHSHAAHGHDHSHGAAEHHNHEHCHGHSHNREEGHGHDHGHGNCHDHGHGHAHGHSHGHGHKHNHGHGHNHGHSCGHGHGENINLRGAVLHVVGDLLQSIGVAIAGLLIWLHPNDPRWYLADPLCTFGFSILVLLTTRSILRDIFHVLMERAPPRLDVPRLARTMHQLPGVQDVHDLHVWNLSMGLPILTAHVHILEGADPQEVLKAFEGVCNASGIRHTTVQICNPNAGGTSPSSSGQLPDALTG